VIWNRRGMGDRFRGHRRLLFAVMATALLAVSCSSTGSAPSADGDRDWQDEVIGLAAPYREIDREEATLSGRELCRQMIGIGGTYDLDPDTTRAGAVGLFISQTNSVDEAVSLARIADVVGQAECRDGWWTLIGALIVDSLEEFVLEALGVENN